MPRGTWTAEPLPAGALARQLAPALAPAAEALRPIVNSLWMALVATAGALALGFARGARSARRPAAPSGAPLDWLIALPWAVPGTVFAVALATTFSVDRPWPAASCWSARRGSCRSPTWCAACRSTGRAALAGLAPARPGARGGRGLARRRRCAPARRVTLPLLRPALVAGGGLAFITALGDFVVSIVLYTFDTRPISIEILSSLRLQEIGLAAAYGVLLIAVSAAAFLALGRASQPKAA